MPDGGVKTLDYNARARRWEGNYDVPATSADGRYTIQIVIVRADGSRRHYAMPFQVDTRAPSGNGEVLRAPDAPDATGAPDDSTPLRLQVDHGGDVARVTALLPWGEKVALVPSTARAGRFFALVRAPRAWAGRTIRVTYILVDRAHNFTTIEAESVTTSPATTSASAP